ncbi:MAG: hypothetical protein AAGF87_08265 [Bacteroidota bacterium]
MPSTIPYDPSIALGNLLDPEALKQLESIGDMQVPADKAEDNLNSQLSLRRSLDMTIQELMDMNIDPSDVAKERDKVDKAITKAATDYATAKVNSLKSISKVKQSGIVHSSLESPIDYNKTVFKTDGLPLSADSLRLNAQYFSFDENTQSSKTQASTIKSFVSGSVNWLGDKFSAQASAAAQSQVNSQYSRHDISGTLVISISCTHKNACILAPLVMDIDKAINTWNAMHSSDELDDTDKGAMYKAATAKPSKKDEDNALTIVSGATYGSSFVAMVHILNSSSTMSTEKMYSVAASMEASFKVSAFLESVSGGTGLDTSFSNDVKNLLSSQNVQSHCTITCMGLIPSIKSQAVSMAVKQFADFDGAAAMAKLQTLQNATADDKTTVNSAATAARTKGDLNAMEATKIQSTLAALAPTAEHSDSVLNINSVMEGMQDYINKAMAGNIGVPINYYLKKITKADIAKDWLYKYYPEYAPKADGDSGGSGGGGDTDGGDGN